MVLKMAVFVDAFQGWQDYGLVGSAGLGRFDLIQYFTVPFFAFPFHRRSTKLSVLLYCRNLMVKDLKREIPALSRVTTSSSANPLRNLQWNPISTSFFSLSSAFSVQYYNTQYSLSSLSYIRCYSLNLESCSVTIKNVTAITVIRKLRISLLFGLENKPLSSFWGS